MSYDGVYYFDPTWDSKKSENDNTYLFSYRYFAMTKVAMGLMDRGRLIDRIFPYFSDDIADEFEEIIKEGLEKVPEEMIKSINYMTSLVYNKYLIDRLRTTVLPHKLNVYGVFLLLRYSLNTVEIGS